MMSSASSPAIRHDIDGLRAVAVLFVILYHAGIGAIGGGFVGVDVFFVISGYLIVPQIVKLMASGQFSFVDFMARRVRRLVPALVPVLVYAVVVGALVLGSGAFGEFLDSLLGAAAFVSNYVFLGQAGYFERTTDTILLLHTWSLGVEFQFYLIAPVVLLLARARPVMALGLLVAASFALAAYLVAQADAWAFYGVLPRLWELAIGGVIGLLHPRLPAHHRLGLPARVVGLALIAFAATQYSATMAFPGVAALLPVLGAVLVISAPATAGDPVRWVLSSAVMRWVGTRSYSLYLWHWPLIVTVALIAPRQTDALNLAAAALALPLAEVSYRYLETPVRRAVWWRAGARVAALFVVPLLAMGAIWGAERGGGTVTAARAVLPMGDVRLINNMGDAARADYLDRMLTDGVDGRAGICSLDDIGNVAPVIPCLAKARDEAPILVIGDSHGRDMFHALRDGLPGQPLLLLHQSSCAPADYQRSQNEHCFTGLTEGIADIVAKTKPALVVLASHWPGNAMEAVGITMDQLDALGVPMVVIGAGPVFKSSGPGLLRQAGMGGEALTPEMRLPLKFKFDVVASDKAVRALAKARGIAFVDRYAQFCDEASCRAFIPGKDMSLIFWDRQHLTLPAMKWYGAILAADPAFAAFAD